MVKVSVTKISLSLSNLFLRIAVQEVFGRFPRKPRKTTPFHIAGISEEHSKYSRELPVMEWRCF